MSTRFGVSDALRLPWRAMGRALPLAAALALLLSCAASWPERYRAAHPDFTARPPAVGAPATDALASLDGPAPEGVSVELLKLEVMRADVDPWQAITPEAMADVPGISVAAADRRCRVREGLHWRRVERVSWFVADRGRLVAFDAPRFGADCSVTHDYHPAREPYLDSEQALRRWTDQRFPGGALPLEERLAMGAALVQAGRLDEARETVHQAKRELDRIQGDLDSDVPRSEKETHALAVRGHALRRAAGHLERAIHAAEAGG